MNGGGAGRVLEPIDPAAGRRLAGARKITEQISESDRAGFGNLCVETRFISMAPRTVL